MKKQLDTLSPKDKKVFNGEGSRRGHLKKIKGIGEIKWAKKHNKNT